MQQEIVQFVLTETGLQPANEEEQIRFKRLQATFSKGDEVQVHFEKKDARAGYGYISKAHAVCREIALATGNSMDEIKAELKKRVGLSFVQVLPDGTRIEVSKSFGDCSRDELTAVIAEGVNLGAEYGVYVY